MFSLNAFNPISLLATSALGPVGGIVAQLATQLVSQIGQQLIQNMGQQMGQPQSVIDMAQGAFAGSRGDIAGQAGNLSEAIENLGRETGASISEQATFQRELGERLMDIAREAAGTPEGKAAASGGKVPSWLMAMAQVLGEKMDEMAADLEGLANEIADGSAGKGAEFTAMSQQFGILTNAASTGLKSIGEGMQAMAKKG